MPYPSDGLFDQPVTSPYFKSLARQVRLCPECGHRTRLAGTLSPNGAYEFCPACEWFRVLAAPEWARVPETFRPAQDGPFTILEGGK